MRVLIWLLALEVCVTASAQQRRARTPNSPANSTAISGAYGEPSVTMKGTLKTITSKELVIIEPGGGNEVTIHRSRRTKFLAGGKVVSASSMKPGAELSIDVSHEPDLSLLAVNVNVSADVNK